MEFNEYQAAAKTTALYLDEVKKTFKNLPEGIIKMLGVSYAGLGMGEVGEVQGKVKKIIRDCGGILTEKHKEEIKKELGDCLWYIAAMCTELDIDMNTVAEANIKKLFSRKERNVLKGSGDNR